MNEDKVHPPKWAVKFLRAICPEHLVEEIEGDLIQKFYRDLSSDDSQWSDDYRIKRAKRRLVWNVLRFFRPGIILRNKFSVSLNQMPMFMNYFKTTYRHLLKSKVNFTFKFGGLTLALFSFLVIALYILYQLSYDRYHLDYDSIYRVNTERKENGKQEKYGIAPLALGPMLKDRFPEIAAFTRISISNQSHIRHKQKVVKCHVFPADSSLFDVFTFKFIQGEKNPLKNPHSIVLSKSLALKIFGTEDAHNQFITINNGSTLYTVTAIIEDLPPNSHFGTDAFIPLKDETDFSINNIISPVDFVDQSAVLYLRFKKDAKPDAFDSKLESLLDEYVNKKERANAGFGLFLQPLKNIYLDSQFKYEFTKKGSTLYLYIFFILGIFLLVVASINYVNLSIADFSTRLREIGVRKVMGAKKMQIAGHVILETVLYCIGSLVMSVLLLYVLFPKVLQLLEPNLQFSMLTETCLILIVGLALLILIIFSTGLPAYWLATSKTINDLKGSHAPGHHSSLGKTLLIAQFMISTVCISSTLMVGRQLDYIHHKDLGFDRNNLVVLTMPEDFSVKKMQVMKQELKSIPHVVGVSNSSFRIGGGYWKDWYTVEGNGEMKSVELYEVFSDDDLFSTLGMKLLEGRIFRADTPADSGAAFVINETAARELGWDDAVGKRILTHPEEKGKWDGTVVGVVADININSLHEKVHPLVMRLPWQRDNPEYFVYVRISGQVSETVQLIKEKYAELVPGYPIDLEFVDDFYNNQYQKENKAFTSLQMGTAIIVLVSSLGIFSLSIYLSTRRMREFGIRKILGATVQQITFMHVGHFLRLAIIANIVALPVSYWLMKEWLGGFAYRTDLNIALFLVVMFISFLLVIFSAGYSSWRAGRMNPVDVIKSQN